MGWDTFWAIFFHKLIRSPCSRFIRELVCFKIKNKNLGKILDDLAMEDDGIFYGHLVHFTVFCYILSTFGIVRCNLAYFSSFGIFTKKNLATLFEKGRLIISRDCLADFFLKGRIKVNQNKTERVTQTHSMIC
jgi:hypothetical protein